MKYIKTKKLNLSKGKTEKRHLPKVKTKLRKFVEKVSMQESKDTAIKKKLLIVCNYNYILFLFIYLSIDFISMNKYFFCWDMLL